MGCNTPLMHIYLLHFSTEFVVLIRFGYLMNLEMCRNV
jgi:hypothetical protein